ncbi:MAG: hypothetical protein GY854_33030 [Deltaproteobacteria bacterium]|nr:hypothetical protein [Deltaproteobacteria bacterium]
MSRYQKAMWSLLVALMAFLSLSFDLLAEECTSWVISGDWMAGEYNKTILHKNRDKERARQVVIRAPRLPYESNSRDPEIDDHLYAYLAIVSNGDSNQVAAGINEHGLAVANNYIAGIFVPSLWAHGTLTLNRMILEYCKTVEEAYLFIDQICQDNMIMTGGALFLADPHQAAVIEHFGKNYTSHEQSIVVDGARARSNDFTVLQGGLGGGDDVRLRYEHAVEFLDEREGDLRATDCFELSRQHHVLPSGKASLNDGSICNYPKNGSNSGSTLFGATFVIDRQDPALSCMWVALGTPDTAIYTPIHLTALSWSGAGHGGGFVENDIGKVIHSSLTSVEIYNLAETIRKNNIEQFKSEDDLGMGRLTPCFTAIESKIMTQVIEAEEQARNDSGGAEEILSRFDIETADSILEKMTALAAGKVDEACNIEPAPGAEEDTESTHDTEDDAGNSSESDIDGGSQQDSENSCACTSIGRHRESPFESFARAIAFF